MRREEYEAAIAAFIRNKGITRCPTACALPTQGTVPAADQAALADYAQARSRSREKKIAVRQQAFAALGSAGGAG